MTQNPVSISLSSYGADFVREQGQPSFIDLLAQAGAHTIELREELFTGESPATLKQAIQAKGLHCVYSSTLELWPLGESAPAARLSETLLKAHQCGAKWLKVSLGHFSEACDLKALARCLADQPVRLLVENDQTIQGGCIEPLVHFFNRTRQFGVDVGMTFDIGNWQWQAQSVPSAAQQLGAYVEYVHCKAVERTPAGKLVATPPSLSDLQTWEHMLPALAQGIVRAIEYPLQGDDLLRLTQTHIATLARLGQGLATPTLTDRTHHTGH